MGGYFAVDLLEFWWEFYSGLYGVCEHLNCGSFSLGGCNAVLSVGVMFSESLVHNVL